jgi:hypothetical protein
MKAILFGYDIPNQLYRSSSTIPCHEYRAADDGAADGEKEKKT